MAASPDRAYNAACGHLASQLGISLAAARRKVDIKATQEGISGAAATLELANQLLNAAQTSGIDSHALLTAQLGTVGNDEYFMIED